MAHPYLRGPRDSAGGVEAEVRAAKRGDGEALASLYKTYAVRLLRYVGRLTSDDGEAEDVVQSVFLKLPRSLTRYHEQEGACFDAWIHRVARNAALDHLRSSARRACYDEALVDAGVRRDSSWVASLDLRAALREMPEIERRQLIMREVIGMSSDEIAREVGRSVSSVYSCQHRARRRLKTQLSGYGSD